MAANWFSAPAPVARRVRAYFAPVNRAAQTPVLFDPAEQGGFSLDAPPAPWISLGWIQEFTRKPGSKTSAVLSGIPAGTLEQVRQTLEAQVSFQFLSWTKLTMALATGSQHMNLLAPAGGNSAKRLVGNIYPVGDSGRRKVHRRHDHCAGRGLHRTDGLCGRASCGSLRAAGTDRRGLYPARDIQRRVGVSGEFHGSYTRRTAAWRNSTSWSQVTGNNWLCGPRRRKFLSGVVRTVCDGRQSGGAEFSFTTPGYRQRRERKKRQSL